MANRSLLHNHGKPVTGLTYEGQVLTYYFITSGENLPGIKALLNMFLSKDRYSITRLMSFLFKLCHSSPRGSVLLQCLQERDWLENLYRHNTSSTSSTAVHKQNIFLVHMLALFHHICWYLECRVWVLGPIRILIWLWASMSLSCQDFCMEHLVFYQTGLLTCHCFQCFNHSSRAALCLASTLLSAQKGRC